MKRCLSLIALAACSSSPAPVAHPLPPDEPTKPAVDKEQPPDVSAKPPTVTKEKLAADTPRTTVAGNTFVAPGGWSIWVQGPATIVEAPEGDSRIAFVDVQAKDADEAVKLAWDAYKPDHKWRLLQATDAPDTDGWSKVKGYAYETSPNEKRAVQAAAQFANGTWTVVIVDIAEATGEKRGAQLGVMFGKFLPKGGAKESFAGKQANKLDAAHLAMLTKFVEDSMKTLDIPGVGLGIVEDGKVVFAGGFGVREVGKPAKVDANTRFIIASNTKALTTLMLAKLVDEKKLTWETPATKLFPEFKLGDPETTKQVLVRHLICACTGMPRQDLEWLLEYKDLTPAAVMKALGNMQPTSKFGELFQYSNVMAAAAGYIGGHVAFPKLELGKAYDQAMQTRVFGPLGMKDTTLDMKKGQTGDYARPYGYDIDGKLAPVYAGANNVVVPVRPAGGAWSSIKDMLAYVQMEISEGKLPNGKAYVSREALMKRRESNVALGTDGSYGMGLMTSTKYGVNLVHHGGDLFGFHSDMMWLPDAKVGLVILTDSDRGPILRNEIQRKLLEVLFDGKPEADTRIASARKDIDESIPVMKKLIVIPADATEAGKLAAHYTSDGLGDLIVTKDGAKTVFDFGEWKSEVASKKAQDGTISFITIAPGIIGLELVVGTGPKRTLILRDAQHEYTFTEK